MPAVAEKPIVLHPDQITKVPDERRFILAPTFPSRVDTIPDTPEIITFPFISESFGKGSVRLMRDFDITRWIKNSQNQTTPIILVPGRTAVTGVEYTQGAGIRKLLENFPTVPTFEFEQLKGEDISKLLLAWQFTTFMATATDPIIMEDYIEYSRWNDRGVKKQLHIMPHPRVFAGLNFVLVKHN